jgi:hypothetical protein
MLLLVSKDDNIFLKKKRKTPFLPKSGQHHSLITEV